MNEISHGSGNSSLTTSIPQETVKCDEALSRRILHYICSSITGLFNLQSSMSEIKHS